MKQETELEREIATLAWDYKSRAYRARLPHKIFAYDLVWRILKKWSVEKAVEFLKAAEEEQVPGYSVAHSRDIQKIYTQALKDIEEAKHYAEKK